MARVMALRSEKAVSGHRSASYVAMRYDGNMAHVVGAMAEGAARGAALPLLGSMSGYRRNAGRNARREGLGWAGGSGWET